MISAVNPFLGVPVSDYLRDAAAAFCLFAALGMPWDDIGDGSDRWWVIIAVLLSVASLAIPYVARAQLIPGFGAREARLAKVAANVPILVSAFAAVVNELVNLDDDFEGGLGTGIAMALAGMALAVQPRANDEDPSRHEDRLWLVASTWTALAAVALGLLTYLGYFFTRLDDGDAFDDVLEFVAILVLFPLTLLVLVGWPALGMMRRAAEWRRVFAVVTFTIVAVGLLALAGDGDGLFVALSVEKWNSPLGGTFLIGAAAGLSVSRPVQRWTPPGTTPAASWVSTASSAMLVSAAALALGAVAQVMVMISVEEAEAATIISIVLMVASAVMAAVAASMLGDPQRNRMPVVGIIGGLVMVSIITVSLLRSQDYLEGMYGLATAMWFTLPALALYALLVPGDVRRTFAPAPGPQHPGGYGTTTPAAGPRTGQSPQQGATRRRLLPGLSNPQSRRRRLVNSSSRRELT